jgi:hypothetical protein
MHISANDVEYLVPLTDIDVSVHKCTKLQQHCLHLPEK